MKDIDRIEIKEPPLQELNKKRSCLFRTCFTGCGCIIFFGILMIILIWYATTPRVQKLPIVPEELAEVLPVYDKSNITLIRFTAGEDRGRAIERAAFIPKLLLSPLLALMDRQTTSTISTGGQIIDWTMIRRAIDAPVSDHRDLYQIEWHDLPASADFVESYYQTELKKRGFDVDSPLESDNSKQLLFRKYDTSGALLIQTGDDNAGTSYVLLTMMIPVVGGK